MDYVVFLYYPNSVIPVLRRKKRNEYKNFFTKTDLKKMLRHTNFRICELPARKSSDAYTNTIENKSILILKHVVFKSFVDYFTFKTCYKDYFPNIEIFDTLVIESYDLFLNFWEKFLIELAEYRSKFRNISLIYNKICRIYQDTKKYNFDVLENSSFVGGNKFISISYCDKSTGKVVEITDIDDLKYLFQNDFLKFISDYNNYYISEIEKLSSLLGNTDKTDEKNGMPHIGFQKNLVLPYMEKRIKKEETIFAFTTKDITSEFLRQFGIYHNVALDNILLLHYLQFYKVEIIEIFKENKYFEKTINKQYYDDSYLFSPGYLLKY